MARDGYVTAPKDSQDRHVAFLERYVVQATKPATIQNHLARDYRRSSARCTQIWTQRGCEELKLRLIS